MVETRHEKNSFKSGGQKISENWKNKEWKETVGSKAVEKRLKNQDFKSTAKAISKTRLSPEWIENNTVTCLDCNKTLDKANFGKWHKNGKCKDK
jgi:hypothetical protein